MNTHQNILLVSVKPKLWLFLWYFCLLLIPNKPQIFWNKGFKTEEIEEDFKNSSSASYAQYLDNKPRNSFNHSFMCIIAVCTRVSQRFPFSVRYHFSFWQVRSLLILPSCHHFRNHFLTGHSLIKLIKPRFPFVVLSWFLRCWAHKNRKKQSLSKLDLDLVGNRIVGVQKVQNWISLPEESPMMAIHPWIGLGWPIL